MTRARVLPVFLALVCVAVGASRSARGDCVIKPNPPPLPAGCVDVVPDCICDAQGQDCHWIFHCITPK
jgi:hypothetical protein